MDQANPSQRPALEPGLEGEARAVVTVEVTAPAVGSGTVSVYATPSMVALMEQAAVACVEKHLAPGEASLGVHLNVSHTAATPPGQTVTAIARLTAIDGRKLAFEIEARDATERIGTARHTRIIVDTTRFAAKLAQKIPPS
ncbi:MAG: thioesterase family protein [Hyphomicrobium sp.]|uniref:thioesterase family protein n=1 Tax=Hyphomicrobium sp. TaxID=82 RepID=UPI003D1245BE